MIINKSTASKKLPSSKTPPKVISNLRGSPLFSLIINPINILLNNPKFCRFFHHLCRTVFYAILIVNLTLLMLFFAIKRGVFKSEIPFRCVSNIFCINYGCDCDDQSNLEILKDIIFYKFKVNFVNPVPSLFINIKHKNFVELLELRKRALHRGVIKKEEKLWIPSQIMDEKGNIYKVKLRFKGDWTDHLYHPNKWSFRIKVKNDKAINGLKVFSIQHPISRRFLGEIFVSEMMRKTGILSPRMSFYKVYVNGKSIGLMHVEEFFSKEMLESQGRKESVIVKFNEDGMWDDWAIDYELYKKLEIDEQKSYSASNIYNSTIEPFSDYKKYPQDYKQSVSLLKGYVEKSIAINQVFDLDNMANFFALLQIVGTPDPFYHGVTWHNMRYYYNPLISKIEIVSFDNNANIYEISENKLEEISCDWCGDIFNDVEFKKKFHEAILRISQEIIESDKYDEVYRAINENYYPTLKSEFVYLRPLNINNFKARARFIHDYYSNLAKNRNQDNKNKAIIIDNKIRQQEDLGSEFQNLKFDMMKSIITAHDISQKNHNIIEINNRVAKAVKIIKIYAKHKGEKEDLKISKSLPITLNSKPILINYSKPSFAKYNIIIEAKIDGRDKIYLRKAAQDYSLAATKNIIPQSSVNQQLKIHKFLTYKNGKLLVKKGRWMVNDYLIVPSNTSLVIDEGTSLFFKESRGIISYGAITMNGSEKNPIILRGKNLERMWKGIAVLKAAKKSVLNNVKIYNISGMNHDRWILTGAISFYKSDVELNNVEIKNITAEDALNIVSSNFLLSNLKISNTSSDAFDSDFSQGKILGGEFYNIGYKGGGDAVDFSGSIVELEKAKFSKIKDKAVSVGENSHLKIKNITINNSSVGVAVKDGSTLDITDSKLTNIQYSGLMAYNKKAEYQTPRLSARKIEFDNVKDKIISQNGSFVEFDGEEIKPENIDVRLLYQTKMRKGIR